VAVLVVSGFRASQPNAVLRLLMAVTEVLVFQARCLASFPISLVVVVVGQITTPTRHPNAVGAEGLETTSMAPEMARTLTEAWELQREPTPAVEVVVVTTRDLVAPADLVL
jgi:hypothetical protein